jgi:hypothetical protein
VPPADKALDVLCHNFLDASVVHRPKSARHAMPDKLTRMFSFEEQYCKQRYILLCLIRAYSFQITMNNRWFLAVEIL